MIPMRSLVEVRTVVGPPARIRYNNRQAVTIQGTPAPGVSSGQALKAMEEVAARTLPQGFAGEWTDTAFQEKRAEGKTTIILGFAVLFAYLFLVALYESWTIPVPVLLSVTVGILGSFVAMVLGGLTLDLYAADRHGGAHRPCSKKWHSHRRIRKGAEGKRGAATRGCNGRCAPALPARNDDVIRFHSRLASAGGGNGRFQFARRDVGTPVFGGMILASFLGIFVIPPLYVTFQAIRERLRPSVRQHADKNAEKH